MPRSSSTLCVALAILSVVGAARCDMRRGPDPDTFQIIEPPSRPIPILAPPPEDMDLPPAQPEEAELLTAPLRADPLPAPSEYPGAANAPQGAPQRAPGGADTLPLVPAGNAQATRKVDPALPPILVDVLSRVDRPYFWRDPSDLGDLVTWAHEATHAMTSQVKGRNGFTLYVLDGRALAFSKHPAMTLGQVASDIPLDERGQLFKHYLVEQRRDWDAEPLYILDEWNSYIHGSICRRQAGWQKRGETERFAREMERYSRQVLASAKKRDPHYREMPQLEAVIEWQADRFRRATAPTETVLR